MSVIGLPCAWPGGKGARALNYHDLEKAREARKIPGVEAWRIASVQALHQFYARDQRSVVASWMTRQDRELAIADNIDYVRRAVGALPRAETLVFLGFSQGAQMAYRAAADFAWRCHGLIILGGDVPPDIAQEGVQLPPAFVARGKRDEWFTDEKLIKDLRFLEGATKVESLVLDAAHEWTAEFRDAAGAFLQRLLL